jgi:TPR repeat protein
VRSRPFLKTALFVLAAGSAAGHALAEDRVRLAQRWTPLTGILSEGEEVPAETSKSPKAAKPSGDKAPADKPAAELAKPALAPSAVHTSTQSLNVVLSRMVTDGQPHGSLGVRTTAVDADLADALSISESGALVTEASSATAAQGGLRAGDVILKFAGRDVQGVDALSAELRATTADQTVSIEVWRAGEGSSDLKRLLVERAEAGNVGASASLGRLLSLGLVFGPKNFGEAATYYLKAAEKGHLASMTRYALFAKDGIGIAKDETLAATWFQKAADGGQEAAMTNLGSLYETGRGVKQDDAEAARWYRSAVDKGHVFAMHRLALLYEAGRGVTKDDKEAVRLLEAASEKGLSEATSWLAEKYEQGRGIAKNDAEASRLNARAAEQVRRAADLGNAVATFNLGILYRIGKGVKKSDTEAAYWVVRSLKLGDKYLIAELMRNPNVLSVDDRKWMQEVLRDEGAYTGPINGSFTPDVRTAMEDLAKRA